jgi:hypothetical protein
MLEGARGTRQYIHAEDKMLKNSSERIQEVLRAREGVIGRLVGVLTPEHAELADLQYEALFALSVMASEAQVHAHTMVEEGVLARTVAVLRISTDPTVLIFATWLLGNLSFLKVASTSYTLSSPPAVMMVTNVFSCRSSSRTFALTVCWHV